MEAHCGGSFTIRVFLNVCFQSWRLSISSKDRGRGSLLLMEEEAMEMFSGLRITLVASKKTEGIKMGGWLYAEGTGLRTSMSLNILLRPVLLQR